MSDDKNVLRLITIDRLRFIFNMHLVNQSQKNKEHSHKKKLRCHIMDFLNSVNMLFEVHL